MKELLSGLSERGKLLVLLLPICLFSILTAYFVKGLTAALVITVFILLVLLIARPVWHHENHGKYRIIRYSIFVIFAAATMPWWEKYIRGFFDSLLKKYLPEQHQNLQIIPEVSPYFALIVLAVVVIIINYLLRDKTGMVKHSIAIDEEFPELDYKQRLQRYCRVIKKTIEDLDLETNWSAEDFTPLDAEVEIRRRNGTKKKITDLLKAIKNDHSTKFFLVLGDPGSGKSVALRKLCKDLLGEVKKTGKVPIYINLKEWYVKEKWSKGNPPTTKQLHDFILSQLKGKDVFADEFLDAYFHKMLESGRFFIILDSFDEIPMVLDEKENSWLIDKLSEVLHYALAGANDSRGILSSRFFRRPTDKFDAKTRLVIRPFTDEKIAVTLKKSINFNEELLKKLFNERTELIPVARNPFANSLIANYARENNNALPDNQAELYRDILKRRLQACKEFIEEKDTSTEEILVFAEEIAFLMFDSENYGLEIPLSEIESQVTSSKVAEIVEILTYARIARLGQGHAKKISFVHRRFNEYFVSQSLLANPDIVPKDAIPKDSRWRDALVLYCEIAPFEKAKEIANFCWEEIKKLEDNGLDLREENLQTYLSSMHCLRFLNEAFRARKVCLIDFQENLEKLVLAKINTDEDKEHNLLEAKLIVEATGIINPSKLDDVLIPAFELNDEWITETAISSCKYLSELSSSLNESIITYFESKPDVVFLTNQKEILSPLKYSEAFEKVYKWLRIRRNVTIMYFAAISILFFISPFLALFTILLYYIFGNFNLSWVFQIITICILSILIVGNFSNTNTQLNGNLFLYIDSIFLELCCLSLILPYFTYSLIRYIKNIALIVLLIVGLPILFFLYVVLIIDVFFVKPVFKVELLNFEFAIDMKRDIKKYFTEKKDGKRNLNGLYLITFLFLFGILPLVHKEAFSMLIVIGFLVVSLIVAIYLPIRLLTDSIKNRKRFKEIQKKKGKVLDRKIIQYYFNAFTSGSYRLKFVQYLKIENITAKGHWTDGKIPYEEGDKASTLLAQLEEKWLGLDR